MNLRLSQRRCELASVLVLTLILCAILGLLMASYLYLVQTQQKSVASSQAWNNALVVAEAGIEEAMAHLNSGVTTNDLAVNWWSKVSSGVFNKSNVVGNSVVSVTIKIPPAIANPYPVVSSTGTVPGPLGTPSVFRTVTVQTKPKPALNVSPGMVVKTTINLQGSKISMDSFDSSGTNSSTGGKYDPAKATDRAEVRTLSTAANAINIDNGKIKGTVHTGPGGKATINNNGSVGDANWVNSGKKGIQSGHAKDDTNITVDDVALPQVKTWLPPVAGNYIIDGVTYKYLLNGTSAWKISALDGAVYINSPDVVLYVTDSIDTTSIHVGPGANLSIYAGCPSVKLGGQGIVNDSGQAKNVNYFGLPSNTNISVNANAAVTGRIYAPNAALSLGGGGKDSYDFVGACATKSVVMNGHFNFHYDESLTNWATATGYVVAGWDEP